MVAKSQLGSVHIHLGNVYFHYVFFPSFSLGVGFHQ